MRSRCLLALASVLTSISAQAQTCQSGWSSEFAPPQVGGTVKAQVIFDPDGPGPQPPALYIAGAFDTAGGVLVNNIASWDGITFAPLGGGLTGGAQVASLVVFDDDGVGPDLPALYAAGIFFNAGDVPVNKIAKWDGNVWSALPEPPPTTEGGPRRLWVLDEDGPGPLPPSLFMSRDNITILAPGNVFKWQNGAWVEVGPFTLSSQNIIDMAAYDPDGPGPAPTSIYVTGHTFYHSASYTVQRLDPSGWHSVGGYFCDLKSGNCVPTDYRALTVYDPDGPGPLPPLLVLGGVMSSIQGVPVRNLAAFNGVSWSDLGGGVNGTVSALAAIDDQGTGIPSLYVGGTFAQAGSISAFNIARWNGTSWWSPATGTDGNVNSIIPMIPGTIGAGMRGAFLGGAFLNADGVTSRGLAAFTPASWSPIGAGINNSILALAAWDDPVRGPGLYAGGGFTIAGGQSAVGIARFDGSAWSGVAANTNGPVGAIAGFGDQLVIGGQFSSVGATAAANIASWNGSAWTPLGSGMNNIVHALATFNEPAGPRLYAGGGFTTAGGQPSIGIARWDGSAWSPVASGTGDQVYALAVYDDGQGPALYVGGKFGAAGGIGTGHVARWNGTAWSALPGGSVSGDLDSSVDALAVHDDGSGPALYAGGLFTQAGGAAVLNVARYKNGHWSPMGFGTDGVVRTLASLDPDGHSPSTLLAGGDFTTIGGILSPHAAQWHDGFWHPIDGGANSPVYAIARFDHSGPPSMYLGGAFTSVGQTPSPRVARWTPCTPCFANCDASAAPPVLNVNDFLCFLNRFAAGDAYANCDRSTAPPVLNVNDFTCFLNAFSAGCP